MKLNNFSQGKQVNEQEHLELLEKMKQFQQQKNVTYLKGATVEQVLKELEECDEVVVKLKDGSTLRIKENAVYINGVLADSVDQPTSEETGSEYIADYDTKKWVDVKPNWVFPEPRKALRTVNVYTNIPISNNYTGVQRFKQIIEKYLD